MRVLTRAADTWTLRKKDTNCKHSRWHVSDEFWTYNGKQNIRNEEVMTRIGMMRDIIQKITGSWTSKSHTQNSRWQDCWNRWCLE